MSFADNIAKYRRIRGESLGELSAAVGVSVERYLAWEQSEAEPTIDQLKALASHFRCTVDMMVRGDVDYRLLYGVLVHDGLV